MDNQVDDMVSDTLPGDRRACLDSVVHHVLTLDDLDLHYVSAGDRGSPVLLVHGFPETWWVFHELIPRLSARHRVFAVDLRGFGDSTGPLLECDSATHSEDLRRLVEHLDVGPVHLTGQDISGTSVFRFAATHPDSVRSLTAIEMGLPGFGLEAFADVTRGGSWHIGMLAAPHIAEMLLAGHEREFITDWAFPSLSTVAEAIGPADVDEFTRSYARPGGWRGARGLYRSMLTEGPEIRALAAARPLTMPVLAVGAGGGSFTADTMTQVSAADIRTALIPGAGHYVALEAPDALADALLDFLVAVDAGAIG